MRFLVVSESSIHVEYRPPQRTREPSDALSAHGVYSTTEAEYTLFAGDSCAQEASGRNDHKEYLGRKQ